jgi:hypothetical protein
MQRGLWNLWREEGGTVPATEWVLVASILVLAAAFGVAAARQTVRNAERDQEVRSILLR